MAISINAENITKEIETSNKPVILDIFAPWCGPCQQMDPIIEKIEKKLGEQYKFAKINVDQERDISIKYGVTSIPTFLFIKNNQVVHKATGYMSEDDFMDEIATAFEK